MKILAWQILAAAGVSFGATVYIDPSYSGPEVGTLAQPYSAWTAAPIVSGNSYLQKRGTTYTSATQLHH